MSLCYTDDDSKQSTPLSLASYCERTKISSEYPQISATVWQEKEQKWWAFIPQVSD